jgi:hypothetical protein
MPLDYDDVRYVEVKQYAFPAGNWPIYTFGVTYYPAIPSLPERADARLQAKEQVPLKGDFSAARSMDVFHASIGLLRNADFFAMRLQPVAAKYLDGPTDSITAEACGVTWTLSIEDSSGEFELEDAAAKRFFRLESEFRDMIFKAAWTPIST